MKESDLILLLNNGSKDAFTALYESYWRQVYNFCGLYLTNKDLIEETVQEVFIKIWESKEFIKKDENFKGLLFIITRNLIFNRKRKWLNENFYKITVLAAMEESYSYSIDEEIDAKDLQKYIDRIIKELPPQRQLIFNLSRKEHMSYKDIAKELNISEKTVERQISDAIKFLRHNISLLKMFLLIN